MTQALTGCILCARNSLLVTIPPPGRTRQAIRAYLQDRYARGLLSPPKLAEAMELKPGMVNAILRGEKNFPMHRIDGAAAFFELSVAELVTRSEQLLESQETQRAAEFTSTMAGESFRRADGTTEPRRAIDLGADPTTGARRRASDPGVA